MTTETLREVPCTCCGRVPDDVALEKHHWRELDGSQHERTVCPSCNTVLQPSRFGLVRDHLLPYWDEQVRAVRERLERIKERQEYIQRIEQERKEKTQARLYLSLHPERVELFKREHPDWKKLTNWMGGIL